jgi:hypothetical protein
MSLAHIADMTKQAHDAEVERSRQYLRARPTTARGLAGLMGYAKPAAHRHIKVVDARYGPLLTFRAREGARGPMATWYWLKDDD